MLRRARFLLFVSLSVLMDGRNSCAQSISIFGNIVPSDPTGAGKTVTLGVKFWSSQSGTISAIRFYRAAVSPSGYVASLYSADGTLLGSVTLAHESGPIPGWQVANFVSPIPISANTTYISAYYCPIGQGADDLGELKNGATNGPLTVPAGSAVGGNGVYAQRIVSRAGKKDGLYWPAQSRADESPLGELAASAAAEGYHVGQQRAPYHGYYYKVLTRQGPNAPGGALDYIVRGKMIGGFALVAYPAEYRNSGVMTFIVNHQGNVYEKDLGPNTARVASSMTAFNPDSTWRRVADGAQPTETK